MNQLIRIQICEYEKDGGSESSVAKASKEICKAIMGGSVGIRVLETFKGKCWLDDILCTLQQRTPSEVEKIAEQFHAVDWCGYYEIKNK